MCRVASRLPLLRAFGKGETGVATNNLYTIPMAEDVYVRGDGRPNAATGAERQSP